MVHMGQALYRTYRARSLDEVIGQDPIVATLKQALKQQRVSHAYLFTGPRGVGKTSVARIFAHAINELPYTDDAPHIDIIEIDAASNRRIDEIRELRDKVHIAPAAARYKVYIIDEVHMLTREAFNALLKTLEEPPAHAIFILATTDASKLPDTIISRTQRFHFRPAAVSDITRLLKQVAGAENISVNDEALTLLAAHSDGSFRDSLSLLDQVRSHASSVDVSAVQQLLGLPPMERINAVQAAISSGDMAGLITQLDGLYEHGVQATVIAALLGEEFRRALLKAPADGHEILPLLEKLVNVPASYDPSRFLEIVLLEAASQHVSAAGSGPEHPALPSPLTEETALDDAAKLAKDTPLPKPAKQVKKVSNDEEIWAALLDSLKREHNTLYGVARMAHPRFPAEDTLELVFAFPFHHKKLNEQANRTLLSETVKGLTGRSWTIHCVLDAAATPPPPASSSKKNENEKEDSLTTINNIFKGAELLES